MFSELEYNFIKEVKNFLTKMYSIQCLIYICLSRNYHVSALQSQTLFDLVCPKFMGPLEPNMPSVREQEPLILCLQ